MIITTDMLKRAGCNFRLNGDWTEAISPNGYIVAMRHVLQITWKLANRSKARWKKNVRFRVKAPSIPDKEKT